MIAVIFSNPWLVVFIMGGPIFTSFICIFNTLYLCRHLSVILKALENSRQISLYSEMFQHFGMAGKALLLHLISGMLIWPKLEIRGGFLDVHDVENFPPHLLRLLRMNMALLGFDIMWFIAAYVILKLK